jgi:ferredoxin
MRSSRIPEPGLEKCLEINTKYAQVWPNISKKREWEGKPDKLDLFSPKPGRGD